jgi:hypothetical protein
LSTGRFEAFTFPDSGEIPYPREGGGHHYDMPVRYFRYETEADYDTAGAILERYSKEIISQYSGASISFYNWRDKAFHYWLLEH